MLRRVLLPGLCLGMAAAIAAAESLPQSPPPRPAFWIPNGLDLYVPVPADNPATYGKIELGEKLFFDPLLSADRQTSCATCHQPELAFTDGRPLAIGVYGRVGRRNVPTILNRGYGESFFWDGRADSLEAQARDAIEGHEDLGLPLADVVGRLRDHAGYRADFRGAFARPATLSEGAGTAGQQGGAAAGDDAGDPITALRITQALASFVRAQMAGDSFLERYRAGDRTALSPSAVRGLDLFVSEGRCIACHPPPLFTDEDFHNTGVNWGADPGRQGISGNEVDRGRFKTPSLRNVALTGPYMHDGSIPTLAEVMDFYDRGAGENPNLDPWIAPLHLTEGQRSDLVAFLEALTSVDLAGGLR